MWGAISVRGKIGMYTFTENMDRHLYREILDNHLYDNANNVYGRQLWDFQHVNDPKHTSRDVRNDLEMKLPGRVLQWPSYNSDLNPIKHVLSAMLKKGLKGWWRKKSL